ncbi:MAG: hypothetical protein Q4A00_05530 [Flavobacteriaceae bacterium]|nr:hypothetical protein [Flavobacteriaceae bacterium]
MSENTRNTTKTSLNQLKNWFKTGLKPTQAQFWAWLDSFWHKDEEIPQDKIKGLSDSLESKADAVQLNHKANADASGLSEEQKQAWKETLGVGELPSNIATIDETGNPNKIGNVHTKEQITELLENSGKNMGNTDLNITQPRVHSMAVGSSLEFDTGGNPFIVSGLPNVSDANAKVLKVDTQGRFITGDAFVFNVPERITVSNIGISNVPEVSELVQRFRNRVQQMNTSPMQKFTQWDIHSHNNITNTNIKVENNSDIYTILKPFDDVNIATGTGVISIHTDRILPMNKDWAVRFGVRMGHDGTPHNNHIGSVTNRKIGLFTRAGNVAIPDLGVYDSGGDYSSNGLTLQSSGALRKFSSRGNNNNNSVIHTANPDAVISVVIIKSGDAIWLQTQYADAGHSVMYSASSVGIGDFGFCVTVFKPIRTNDTVGLVSGVEYLIFD